jgi:negative regulator of flagellin synthesis FlgM
VPAAQGNRSNPVEGVARGDGKPVEPVTQTRDTVSVSDSALLMQRLEEAVAKSPTGRADHVQQIKDALARNEYSVDAQRVADKLLQFERETGT